MAVIAAPDAGPVPTISVAVCTRDRPEKLGRLLDSLSRQTRAPDSVVVVDNAPASERTRLLVGERHPQCRYVLEPVPGLDFARNRALRECGTTVIAFIDDDAVAAPDWVDATVRTFSTWPRLAACMGRVEPLTLLTPGSRLFEANGGFARGHRRIHLPPGAGARPPGWPRPLIAWSISIGSGVSMALRRDAALAIGGFDEALDMGEVLPGGGDLDMLWRLLEAGHEVLYEPAVHAWHEHRAEAADAERQIIEHNRAMIAMLTKSLESARLADKGPVLAFLMWRLFKPLWRVAKRLAGRDPMSLPGLAALATGTWRGLVAYPRASALAAVRRAAGGGR
jgi:GT2 family glycosyltransferase